jgi:hypothetical protein
MSHAIDGGDRCLMVIYVIMHGVDQNIEKCGNLMNLGISVSLRHSDRS